MPTIFKTHKLYAHYYYLCSVSMPWFQVTPVNKKLTQLGLLFASKQFNPENKFFYGQLLS